jgi:hypothetical protein
MIELSSQWWFLPVFVVVTIWSGIWKGIGLWKAARNKQKIWFICMCVVNSVGILEIVYLKFFQKKRR